MVNRTLRRSRGASSEPANTVEQPIGTDGPIDDGIAASLSGGDDIEFLEPADIAKPADELADEPADRKRGRGRPRKSAGTRSAKTKTTAEDLVSLETLLLGVHTCLSVICKNPDLTLDTDEAQMLAKAINKVNEQYDYSVLSPKQAAWMNLLTAMGTVYVPRIMSGALMAKIKPSPKGEVITPDKPRPIVKAVETINGN